MKIKIDIPESLNEITLGQYQNYLKIEEPTTEDLLRSFLDVDMRVINKMRTADVESIISHLSSIFEEEPKPIFRFDLNGKEHGFIPDLDKISYGENKDVTSYINDWQTMHRAMTVLFRPITMKKRKKYLIEEYEGTAERNEEMRGMPLSVVMGAMVFFTI